MRKILDALKAKKIVGILLDQNTAWSEGVFVNFFGRQACTNKGLAIIVLKLGTPVIPCFSVRQNDGHYKIVFEEEIPLVKSGDKTRDIEDSTFRFTNIIEKYVRKYPEQWFWFHRRWKTLPYCEYQNR